MLATLADVMTSTQPMTQFSRASIDFLIAELSGIVVAICDWIRGLHIVSIDNELP